MTEYIDRIVGYLSSVYDDVTVKQAYSAENAQRPVESPALYVEAVSLEGGCLEICISADVPARLGGGACQSLAESVCGSLSDEDCPVKLEDLRFGGVEYRKQSMSYRVKVRGVVDEANKRYEFFAYYFASDSELTVESTVKDYKLVRNFAVREINEIFSGMPVGVTDEVDFYDITLIGVKSELVETLSSNGVFALDIGGETFYFCYCVQSSENGVRRADVKIRAYRGEHEENPEVPFPGLEF